MASAVNPVEWAEQPANSFCIAWGDLGEGKPKDMEKKLESLDRSRPQPKIKEKSTRPREGLLLSRQVSFVLYRLRYHSESPRPAGWHDREQGPG